MYNFKNVSKKSKLRFIHKNIRVKLLKHDFFLYCLNMKFYGPRKIFEVLTISSLKSSSNQV